MSWRKWWASSGSLGCAGEEVRARGQPQASEVKLYLTSEVRGGEKEKIEWVSITIIHDG